MCSVSLRVTPGGNTEPSVPLKKHIISLSTNSFKTSLYLLDVIALSLPVVELQLAVVAKDLANVLHVAQPGHYLQDSKAAAVLLKMQESFNKRKSLL